MILEILLLSFTWIQNLVFKEIQIQNPILGYRMSKDQSAMDLLFLPSIDRIKARVETKSNNTAV